MTEEKKKKKSWSCDCLINLLGQLDHIISEMQRVALSLPWHRFIHLQKLSPFVVVL